MLFENSIINKVFNDLGFLTLTSNQISTMFDPNDLTQFNNLVDYSLNNPNKTYYVDGIERNIAYRYMIDLASKGKDIELWGKPDAFKDILYVKDLCQLMYNALFANVNGGIYNAGTGIKTTLEKQIKGIIDVFSPRNNQSSIIYKPENNSFISFVMDIDNARKDLNYEPKYTYIKYLQDYKKEQRAKRFDNLWKK